MSGSGDAEGARDMNEEEPEATKLFSLQQQKQQQQQQQQQRVMRLQ